MMPDRLAAALLGALIASVTPVRAAEDAVCRPYATALTEALIKFEWLRAFSHCSLLEEDHPVPPTEWRPALNIVDPDATPLDRSDVAQIGIVPATDRAVGESGFAPDTDGWRKWCRTNFPGSFRAADGTVIFEVTNIGNRHRCPG